MAKEVKTRAPKARNVEELITESVKKMTDKEKAILIDYLKEQLNVKDQQIEAYRQNIESRAEQHQRAEKELQECEQFYRAKLGFIDTQVNAFVAAVKASTVGGAH